GIGAAPLQWRGDIDGTWDNNNHANWAGGANSGKFVNGDRVLFDDTATGTTNVTVAAAGVSPAQTHFVNSTLDYVISGPGAISGAGDLIKDGAAMVTLTGNNNFTGQVQINAGTLALTS